MNDGDFLLSIIKKLDVEEGDWEKLYSNLEDNSILYKYTPSDSKRLSILLEQPRTNESN